MITAVLPTNVPGGKGGLVIIALSDQDQESMTEDGFIFSQDIEAITRGIGLKGHEGWGMVIIRANTEKQTTDWIRNWLEKTHGTTFDIYTAHVNDYEPEK